VKFFIAGDRMRIIDMETMVIVALSQAKREELAELRELRK
jgi:hypothetical protein